MASYQGFRDEETPLLHAERALERVYQTPFPWFQFSVLFALQAASYMPYFVTRPFVPDVRSSLLFKMYGPKTLLSVNSKYRNSKRRKGCGILCRVAGMRYGPSMISEVLK